MWYKYETWCEKAGRFVISYYQNERLRLSCNIILKWIWDYLLRYECEMTLIWLWYDYKNIKQGFHNECLYIFWFYTPKKFTSWGLIGWKFYWYLDIMQYVGQYKKYFVFIFNLKSMKIWPNLHFLRGWGQMWRCNEE